MYSTYSSVCLHCESGHQKRSTSKHHNYDCSEEGKLQADGSTCCLSLGRTNIPKHCIRNLHTHDIIITECVVEQKINVKLAGLTPPTIVGLTESPRKCDIRICIADAVALLAGMIVYYNQEYTVSL